MPKANANGVPFGQGALILLATVVLINAISFFFQDRYVQGLLKRPNILREFGTVPFGLRFYEQNLAIATREAIRSGIALSLIGFYPLLRCCSSLPTTPSCCG